MIPVAQVEAGNWTGAAISFPKALRLAAAEMALDCDCEDAKPALYQAYVKLLEHQGRSADAGKYCKLAERALHVVRPSPTFGKDGQPVSSSVIKYEESDLYPPELLK